MKRLDEVYPVVTGGMWRDLVSGISLCAIMFIVAVTSEAELWSLVPLLALTLGIGMGAVLTLSFVLPYRARRWVHKHCIGYGYGVIYLAVGTRRTDELREEVESLCQRDVVHEVANALSRTLKSTTCVPDIVLAIAGPATAQQEQWRGKPWRILGVSMGTRIRMTWPSTLGTPVRHYRRCLGLSIGSELLDASGYGGSRTQRYNLMNDVGLGAMFLPGVRVLAANRTEEAAHD